MPYVVTRRKASVRKPNLQAFLNGTLSLSQLVEPTNRVNTGTVTNYYDQISPAKLAEVDINYQVRALEAFYEMYKHMDVTKKTCYNYEMQVAFKTQVKRTEHNKAEVERMVKDLIEEQGFQYFDLYSTFWQPKHKPGKIKWRRIDAPCNQLMAALRHLKELFELMMDGCCYHTSAFAYIKGRCCKDAAERHAQNKSNWYLKLDFSDFFGSITPEFTMRMMSEVYPFSEIVKSEEGKTALRNCLNLCFLDGRLPQGTPISPLLSNIIMIAIDHKLYNYLSKKTETAPSGRDYKFIYTRYADDMVISNKTTFDYKEIIDVVNRIMTMFDAPLKLNGEKTRYGSIAGENWILGVMVNQEYKVTVGHKRKKLLKSIINNYIWSKANGETWGLDDLYHLQGEISYCKSVEGRDINKQILEPYSKKLGRDIERAIIDDIKALAA